MDREEPSRRVTMPASWQTIFEGSSCGRAEFRRTFNQPTNLEAHEHVWIVFQGVRGAGWVDLNGQRLGGIEGGIHNDDETAEFEITPQSRAAQRTGRATDVLGRQSVRSAERLVGASCARNPFVISMARVSASPVVLSQSDRAIFLRRTSRSTRLACVGACRLGQRRRVYCGRSRGVCHRARSRTRVRVLLRSRS